jgi:hypothetical protein
MKKAFSFWDFYDPESGDIVIPDGVILRFVPSDAATETLVSLRIPPDADRNSTER